MQRWYQETAMELLATQNGRETSKDFHPSNVFYVQGLQIRDKFLLRSRWDRPICTYDNPLFTTLISTALGLYIQVHMYTVLEVDYL